MDKSDVEAIMTETAPADHNNDIEDNMPESPTNHNSGIEENVTETGPVDLAMDTAHNAAETASTDHNNEIEGHTAGTAPAVIPTDVDQIATC